MREWLKLIKNYLTGEDGSLNLIGKLLVILIIVFLTQVIIKAIKLIFARKLSNKIKGLENESKIKTVLSIFVNFLTVFIYFIAVTIVLGVFNINTSSILAVAGVGGVAVAFAAQSLVKDVINGAFILLENQYNIGDWVTIDGKTGGVVFMGIRLTKLVDLSGSEFIIPNGNISTVINHSRNDMRTLAMVTISDKKDYDFIEKLINDTMDDLYKSVDFFTQKPKVLGVEEFSDYAYKVMVVGYAKNGMQWEGQRLMRRDIVKALLKNEISFSTIEVKNE